MKHLRIFSIALLVLCLFAFAACGGGEDTTPATTDAVTTTTTATVTTTAPQEPGMTINGSDISEFSLLATEETAPYIELIRDEIHNKVGVRLPIVETATGKHITLTATAGYGGVLTEITAEGDAITIATNGKSALNLGANAFIDLMEECTVNGSITMTIENTVTRINTENLAPSALSFYNENGELDRDGDGTIHIVFIGGSLTQTNAVWCPPVVQYFQNQFPNKTVTYTNAAIGATDSTMGAIRFAHDVMALETAPDIVFVEYAVNDAGFNGNETDFALKKNGVYIESIIRQCLAHENQPAVVLLNFPRGFEPDSTDYNNWKHGVALKERIAENYGVATVNVLDYVEALYAEQKATNADLTYGDFLLQYYNASDMVHPTEVGYAVFRDAILAALEANFESFLTNRTDAPFCLAQYEKEILTTWQLIPLDDEDVILEGTIKHYTSVPSYPSTDPCHVPGNTLTYPRFVDGLWQIESGANFTVTLKAKADVIGIYGLYSPSGMKVEVINGKGLSIGTFDTGENHTRPYLTTFETNVTRQQNYTLRAFSGNNGTVYRIGYLIVGTYPES